MSHDVPSSLLTSGVEEAEDAAPPGFPTPPAVADAAAASRRGSSGAPDCRYGLVMSAGLAVVF